MKKLQNVLIILAFMLIVYTCAQTVEIYQIKDINAKADSGENKGSTGQNKIEKGETNNKSMEQKEEIDNSIVDEEQRIRLFRDDYTWHRQIYDRASELAEEHGLYQFLDMEEPWISSEGNYCTYYMTEYSDSGVYLEAQSKEDYELTYQDSVYTENFAGMDYRIIDFDRQMLAELEVVILQNGVNERCRLYSMENGEAVISTASGTWYCIDMTNKTMRQTDHRGEEKAEEKDWDFHGAWGESYQHVIGDWIRIPEYEKEFADTVGGTVQYDPYLKNHIGKDLIYERYALYDLDKDGTPELILLSDRNYSMNAIFSYKDGLVYCGTYHNALYTDDGKIIERGNWWGGSVMVTESWAITEFQGGKVVGEESLWKEYKDYDMKDAVYIRDVDGESTEISYEEYRDVKNALLNQADFVRNIRCNEL